MNKALSQETASLINSIIAQLRSGEAKTASQIRQSLNLSVSYTTKISQAFFYLQNHNYVTSTGVNKGKTYKLIDTTALIHIPVKQNGVSAPKPQPSQAQVLFCKPALKILVKQVMEDNTNLEGELQRAVMKALLVLV